MAIFIFHIFGPSCVQLSFSLCLDLHVSKIFILFSIAHVSFVIIDGERETNRYCGAFILWNEMDDWVKCCQPLVYESEYTGGVYVILIMRV
jgi:hypothetical protein